jgi:hypothetical protein
VIIRYTQSSVISDTQLPEMSIGAAARAVAGGAAASFRRCAAAPSGSAICTVQVSANAAKSFRARVIRISASRSLSKAGRLVAPAFDACSAIL